VAAAGLLGVAADHGAGDDRVARQHAGGLAGQDPAPAAGRAHAVPGEQAGEIRGDGHLRP
jgi:hypothetical protein